MSRRYFITVLVFAVTTFFGLGAQARTQVRAALQDSRASKLQTVTSNVVGTWRLVSDEFRRPSGEVIPFPGLGPNVRGQLIYDAGGHMSVHIVNADRPRFEGIRSAPCDDVKAAVAGYRGYFGTYEVDEREGVIVHHVDSNLLPNAAGQQWKRSFKLSGDRLILEAEEAANGEQGTAVITWERAR